MMARALRQLLVLLGLAVIPALIQAALHRSPPVAAEVALDGEILLADALKLGSRVLWVDARTRGQFERSHIPGAVLLNESQWDALAGGFLDVWETESVIVVYCDGGGCDASHAVARRIKEDFQLENEIKVLKGGWKAWERQK